MAEGETMSAWTLFISLPVEIQLAVVRLLSRCNRNRLRGVSTQARLIVNKAVREVAVFTGQGEAFFDEALHLRFPDAVKFSVDDAVGSFDDSALLEYCMASLQHHKSITSFDLSQCPQLGSAAVLALSIYCKQAQELMLPATGKPGASYLWCIRCNLGCPVGSRRLACAEQENVQT